MDAPLPYERLDLLVRDLIEEHNQLVDRVYSLEGRIEEMEAAWAAVEPDEPVAEVQVVTELTRPEPISEAFSPLAKWEEAVAHHAHYLVEADVYSHGSYL